MPFTTCRTSLPILFIIILAIMLLCLPANAQNPIANAYYCRMRCDASFNICVNQMGKSSVPSSKFNITPLRFGSCPSEIRPAIPSTRTTFPIRISNYFCFLHKHTHTFSPNPDTSSRLSLTLIKQADLCSVWPNAKGCGESVTAGAERSCRIVRKSLFRSVSHIPIPSRHDTYHTNFISRHDTFPGHLKDSTRIIMSITIQEKEREKIRELILYYTTHMFMSCITTIYHHPFHISLTMHRLVCMTWFQ